MRFPWRRAGYISVSALLAALAAPAQQSSGPQKMTGPPTEPAQGAGRLNSRESGGVITFDCSTFNS